MVVLRRGEHASVLRPLRPGPCAFFGRAQAFIHGCTGPVYLTFFRLSVDPQPCTELGQFDFYSFSGRSTMRLLHLTAVPSAADNTAFLAAFNQLAVALDPAFDAIGTAQPAR